MIIIILKIFIKRKILSIETIESAHTRTQRHPHTRVFRLYTAKFTQLKTGSKILSIETIESAHTRTRTQRHPHTRVFRLYKAKFTQLKTGSKRRLQLDEDSSTEQKTWQPYSFGKRYVFRVHLNEPREGFCRRGRGKSFHVDGPKTEMAREPRVESLVRGIWRLIPGFVTSRVSFAFCGSAEKKSEREVKKEREIVEVMRKKNPPQRE